MCTFILFEYDRVFTCERKASHVNTLLSSIKINVTIKSTISHINLIATFVELDKAASSFTTLVLDRVLFLVC